MRVTVSAELPLDAQAYLLERDGAAFRSFMCEEMSLLEFEITQCWREGPATKIRLNSKPDVGAWIPGALAQKVPDKLEYFDEVTYRPDLLPATGPFELHIHSKAPFLGDKGKFESRVMIEALGPGRCRHTLEQTIDFKGLWGLGAVAKKLAKKSLEDSFEDMPGIMAKWAEIRQELLQTPHGRERLLAGRPRIEGVPWIDEHVACIKQGAQHRGRGKPHRSKEGEQAVAVHAAAGPTEPARAPAGPAAQQGPAADAGVEEAVPPSAFAAAAGAKPVGPGQREGEEVGSQQPVEGKAGEPVGVPAASGGRPATAPSRQATGLTAFYTASEELPPPPAEQQEQQAQRAQQAEPMSGAAPADAHGRVQVAPVAADGQPLPAVAEGGGSEAGSRPPSSAAYSADRSSSEDGEEDWATCAPWRAYYQAHGLAPLRRVHTLPPKLVERVFSGRRRRPVEVKALGAGPEAGGLATSRGLMRRLKAALARWFGRGGASSAAP